MAFDDILTERLLLRPLRPDDAEAVFAYRSLNEVSRYQCWEPRSEEEVRDFIHGMERTKPDTPDTWYQIAIEVSGNSLRGFINGQPRLDSHVDSTFVAGEIGIGTMQDATVIIDDVQVTQL